MRISECKALENHSWYALQVNSRQELPVAAQLRMKGYEELVPVYEVRKRLSDRTKIVTVPVFPGYVFCYMDLSSRVAPAVTTPGVIRIVGAGRIPIAVDEIEIGSIRRAIEAGAALEPYPSVAVGQCVRIIDGSLAGCEGVVLREKSGWRLVVSVSLLNRAVAVEIEACSVESVDKNRSIRWQRPQPVTALAEEGEA